MRRRHPLAHLIAVRLLQSVVVWFGALIVCFVLAAAAGDPADVQTAGQLGSTPERVRALRDQLGYGDPFLQRLGHFVAHASHGDFGTSFQSSQSAFDIVMRALPSTLLLVGCALTIALASGVGLALVSVLRRERVADRAIRRFLAVAQGIPDFWLATMLVLLFSVTLQMLPSIGFDGPDGLVLPTIALAVPLLPPFVRLARGSLLDVMKLDFITSLRGKGLSERDIVVQHALRNALPPLVTFAALQVGWLIGGTIIVESIFAWPGIGNLVVEAVRARDVAVVKAVVAVVAISYIVLNLAADVLTALLDPRIRVARA
ncbi:MAG TPA: ABC transporter permease [Conexibacter sp.]|nr:ABC transporter permease [Conexibacter sp.]